MLDDVGHFKFTRTHILSMEREMLSTLGFKIVNTSYTSYHEASLILAEMNLREEREEAQKYLAFLSYISVYNHQIGMYQPQNILALALVS
jgi:ribosomal protein L30E